MHKRSRKATAKREIRKRKGKGK